MARGTSGLPTVSGWRIVGFSLQVCVVLAIPLALCAYFPTVALTWVGVVAIALLGFALLHGGWCWLVPIMGAVTLGSLFHELPIARPVYTAGCAVLSVMVAALIISGELRGVRRVRSQDSGQASIADARPSALPNSSEVSVRMVDGTISVSWLAPTSTGGMPITSYQVQASFDGGSSWTILREVPGSQRAAMIDDLSGRGDICFRVAAVNAAGVGPASRPTAPITPMGTPGSPQALASEPGDRQVRLTWMPPVNDGGYRVQDYAVRMSVDGGATWVDIPRPPSAECVAVVTGLTNGLGYQFTVCAINAAGHGRASVACQATPAGLPGPPTVQVCTPGDQFLTIAWAAPTSDGGMPLIGYVIESSHDGGSTWVLGDHPSPNTTSATLTGLANGIPYIVRISAVNVVGRGPASAPSAPTVPMGLPSEVGGVEATVPRDTSARSRIGHTAAGHDSPAPRGRKRAPKALVGTAIVIAIAALVGFGVLRTMDTSSLRLPGQVSEPSQPPGGVPPAAAPASVADANPSSAAQGACLPDPPAGLAAVPVIADGQVLGRLVVTRGGSPLLDQQGFAVQQGIDGAGLVTGLGHHPSTPAPGTTGNSVIIGTRSDMNAPFVHLDQLQPGDEVTFTDVEGLVSRYVIDSTVVVAPDENWFLGADPIKAGMPTLTLATCDLQQSLGERLVVFARTSV
ncbi:MAG: fibronectin type III domain-containing protein [Actinomycetales bacterium]|nr:fibronectin type III domain-containing protein [Actinomycetales bacterium]